MSLLNSIFFGCPGTYNILGTRIEFINDPYDKQDSTTWSRIYNCVSQRYSRIFLDTVAKICMCKLLTGEKTERNVCAIDTGVGYTTYSSNFSKGAEWKKTVVFCSGISSVINLLSLEIIAAKFFSNYVSWPVTMLMTNGITLSILDEIYPSADVKGEFTNELLLLARNKTPFILSTAILSAQIALGISILSKI